MASEMKGFVFAVIFIVVFATFLATIPEGYQGQADTPDMVIPVDPNIITGFSDSQNYSKSAFSVIGAYYQYVYPAVLGGREWICRLGGTGFSLGAKVIYGGILWLGQMDSVKFISSEGVDRDDLLTFVEIATDADDGVIRYNLQYYANGASAGGFVVYWNITTYSDPEDAWDVDELYLLHGVGIQETATADIGALLISLLLLQLPEVPLLINILLITPLWACIVFVLWFIIKEMIPFV